MATLDQVLKLLIQADAKGLSAGLTKAQGELRNFGAAATRTFSGVQSAFAALGVTLSAGALAVGLKKTIDSMDQLNDASKRLGVSTEFLSGMGYAAEQSGASLEELQTGLRFLNRSLVEARDGSKEMATTLRQFGISAIDNTETALTKLADAFARMPNGAEKTAAAIKIFGRSGATLIPLLNEGSAGLRRFYAEAEKMGLIVSGPAAQAADDLNDNLNTLSNAFRSVGISIAQFALPGLSRYAKAAGDAAKESQGLYGALKGIGQQAGRDLFEAFNGLDATRSDIAAVTDRLNGLRQELAQVKANDRGGFLGDWDQKRIRSLVFQISQWEAELARLRDQEARLTQAQKDAAGAAKEAADAKAKAAKAADDAAAGNRAEAETTVDLVAKYKALAKAIKESRAESSREALGDVKDSSVLTINRLKDQAQSLLERGDAESAERLIKQAKAINDYLLETKQISKTYYQTQADAILKLTEQGQAVLDGQPLTLPAAPDLQSATEAGNLAWDTAQAAVNAKGPLVIPGVVQVAPNSFADEAGATADGRVNISAKGFALGGPIRGPGSGLSDSILARLSNGEFVMRAAAVKQYGMDFLSRMNALQIPAFASGGPVGTPIHLHLDGHTVGPMMAAPSVAKQLGRLLSSEVLKRGRR